MPRLREIFTNVICTALVLLYNAVRAYVDSLTPCKFVKKKSNETEVDGVDVDVNVNNVNCCHYHSD